ncbi:MAG: ABC transporter permease [Chloroflexota bacterium]|nr:ABC transporter permease [Chloroflexota bacterium]
MATVAQPQVIPNWETRAGRFGGIATVLLRYMRRNPEFVIGLCLLGVLLAFVVIGHAFVDLEKAKPLSNRPLLPPSPSLPFGTDKQGRNLLAVMVLGTPLTLQIGVGAGLIGVSIGTLLALASAFYRGTADAIIRGIVDVGLTIPGLMVLITLAMNVKGGLSVVQMTLVVAALAWLFPARVIRAQVLTLRERAYIDIARLSGVPTPLIIIKEVLPNLMPFIVASLVGSVSAAVLASVGLEVLGLGSFDSLSIGMTLYWVIYYAAIINSWWWWWLPPIVIIIILFTGLFMLAVGLDEISNPRLRKRV